jgi:fermentation-respiration switch protein FrsA (DUF1100 family)
MLIPKIGEQCQDAAGLISLAGAARPLEDITWEQLNYLYSQDGKISDDEKIALESIKKRIENIKSPELNKNTPTAELITWPAEYWLSIRNYKPSETAKKLNIPMLILQGERDYQVTMEDFKIWKQSLCSKDNVTFINYPKLNHLFLQGTGEGKSTPQEYSLKQHIPEVVINDIANWIKNQ